MVIYIFRLIFSVLKVFQGFPLQTFASFALKFFDVNLRFDIQHVGGELVSMALPALFDTLASQRGRHMI